MTDLATASKKLRKLLTLPDGWNYGTGGKPSRRALLGAVVALQHLSSLGAGQFDVLPTDAFGITIMASHGDSVAEINISPDGLYDVFIERGGVIVADSSSLTFGGLIEALEAEGWRSLKSLGSHTRSSTVWFTTVSQARPSKTRAWARRSFAPIVESKGAGPSAHISTASIEDWEANHQFSSGSLSRPLVVAHG